VRGRIAVVSEALGGEAAERWRRPMLKQGFFAGTRAVQGVGSVASSRHGETVTFQEKAPGRDALKVFGSLLVQKKVLAKRNF